MPTDTVSNRSFKDLFESQSVRYEIPFFQRGYTWNKPQWKKLFSDIEESILDNVEHNNFEETEHFFGPIVVLEKRDAPHPSLKRYYVIDGQQRITTVYLMLALIKAELELKRTQSPQASIYIGEISKLLNNNISGKDDYLSLKVFSSKGDRLPTYQLIYGENPSSPNLQSDLELYQKGTNNIDQFEKWFKRTVKNFDVPKLYDYFQAITKSLKIVWIPLDENKDDAQAIFESLNDAGMPLTAAELLCNFLFKPLIDENELTHETLHNQYWLRTRKKIGEGNFEDYLRNLFSVGEKKRIGKGRRLYVHFKNRNKGLSKSDSNKILKRILEEAPNYNHITRPFEFPHDDSAIATVLNDLSFTNVISHLPYSLSILRNYDSEQIDRETTINLLHELYVMIVRLKMKDARMTKFDTMFPNLLSKVLLSDTPVLEFQRIIREENLWIDNQALSDSFLSKALYNPRELNFTNHVLQKIDKHLHKHGELPDYSTLSTVEHILPQTLDKHWKDYLKEDANDLELPRVVNTVGNLGLNSSPANSSKGQKPFDEKVKNYKDLTRLGDSLINISEPWNIKNIKERSLLFADYGILIWSWKA